MNSKDQHTFLEEEARIPVKGRAFKDTTYLEVTSDELLRVSVPLLAAGGISESEAVAKAYALITEAHLFCRNVTLWNEQVKRLHADELTAAVMAEVGTLDRTDLVVSALKKIGHSTTNRTDAERLFNRWLEDEVRHEDFLDHGPFELLHGDLLKEINPIWQMLPRSTESRTKSPRARRKDEHETAPWWSTDDAWWPSPSDAMMKARREQIYQKNPENPRSRALWFRDGTLAASLLRQFTWWVKDDRAEEGEKKREPKAKPRNKVTKKFVSPKTNGAALDESRKFSKG